MLFHDIRTFGHLSTSSERGRHRARVTLQVLEYLAELVVNGPSHPGAVGPPPATLVPSTPRSPGGPVPAGWRDVLVICSFCSLLSRLVLLIVHNNLLVYTAYSLQVTDS